MKPAPIDADSPWKEAIDHAYADYLGFFYQEIQGDLDWERDHESLEQELRKLTPAARVGKRLADKLVKAYLAGSGDEAYLHTEVQGEKEEGFERRLYVYNYRAEDRFNHPVVTLVVLADDDPDWRPSRYVFRRWRCGITFELWAVKLLDYAGKEEELERDANPFARLVLAHLKALETRQDMPGRKVWKVRLLKGLHDRVQAADDMRFWLRILDWLLPLPAELAQQVRDEITRFEEERKVPYITSFEQIGIEKGMEKGHRKGLLEGAATALEVKFGSDGLALLPELEAQADLAVIQKVLAAIKGAQSVDDLRRLLPANGSAPAPAP